MTPVRPARRCPRTGLSPSPRGSRGHVDRVSGPHAHDPQRGSTEVFPDLSLPAVHLPSPCLGFLWQRCPRLGIPVHVQPGSACCSSRSRGTLGTAGPALPSARGRPHRRPSHCPGAESGAETTHRAPSRLGAGPPVVHNQGRPSWRRHAHRSHGRPRPSTVSDHVRHQVSLAGPSQPEELQERCPLSEKTSRNVFLISINLAA